MNLDKDVIDQIFWDGQDSASILLALYQLVFDDWDEIDHIDGYPAVSKDTWDYICRKFVALDCLRENQGLAGFLWVNQGFTVDDALLDWEVDISNVDIVFK